MSSLRLGSSISSSIVKRFCLLSTPQSDPLPAAYEAALFFLLILGFLLFSDSAPLIAIQAFTEVSLIPDMDVQYFASSFFCWGFTCLPTYPIPGLLWIVGIVLGPLTNLEAIKFLGLITVIGPALEGVYTIAAPVGKSLLFLYYSYLLASSPRPDRNLLAATDFEPRFNSIFVCTVPPPLFYNY